MFVWTINWRRNLFLSMLMLLLFNGFFTQTKQLSCEWWIEQERMPTMSWQVVRRTVTIPSWYIRYQNIFCRWQCIIKTGLMLFLYYHVLKNIGQIWIWCLQKSVLYMMRKGIEPLPFYLLFSTPLRGFSKTANIFIEFDMLSIPIKETIISSMSQEMSKEFNVVGAYGKNNTQMLLLSPPVIDLSEELQTEITSSGTEIKPVASPRKTTVIPYTALVEQEMRKFYNTLSEKDKRRYAGIEALKKPRGGIVYISSVLNCSRKTVSKGIKELQELPFDSTYEKRIRSAGAGRKGYSLTRKDIDSKFLDVVKNHTAGDPMNEEIKWTNMSQRKISALMFSMHNVKISTTVVRQLLKNNNYRRRKAQKQTTMKKVKNRNKQFVNINGQRAEYEPTPNPIVSMDTKKKENLGNFQRDGHLYTQGTIQTYDHDFPSFAEGSVIPHAIYDCKKNTGYINLGTSKDTGEFACDCLRNWWYNEGRNEYPDATSILILCDGGGSNSSRHYLFKEDLQKLVDEIGIEIRIAHYPPYCSKYNPIEHRFFPHVTRACQGVVFKNMQIVKELMEKTETRKGLKATVQIVDKVYETGRKVAEGFKENMKIVFDEFLPAWNYRIIPSGQVI